MSIFCAPSRSPRLCAWRWRRNCARAPTAPVIAGEPAAFCCNSCPSRQNARSEISTPATCRRGWRSMWCRRTTPGWKAALWWRASRTSNYSIPTYRPSGFSIGCFTSAAFASSVAGTCTRNARVRASASSACSAVFPRTTATTWSRTGRSRSPASSATPPTRSSRWTYASRRRHRDAASSPPSQASIDRSLPLWGIERKRRNIDVESLAGRVHHAVGSGHETGRRGERHAAGIFEILARLEHWLLAHHAGAAHLLQAALRICDAPMARLELDGLAAAIGERDGIGPEEIAVLGRGTLGQKARGRRDLDLAGHGTIRGFGGIHRRAFSPNPGFLSLCRRP